MAVLPVGHPLALEHGVTLEALLDQYLISLGEATTVTSQLRHAALRIGREPRFLYTVTTIDAARALVAAGLGIALQPGSIPYSDERDQVHTLPVEGNWAARSYRIGYLTGKPLSPAADAFVAQMTSPNSVSAPTGNAD